MINPVSTRATTGLTGPLDAPDLADRSRLATLRAWVERLGRRRLLIILDLAAVIVIAAAFAQVGPPEVLFHVAFVILTIEAFVFGRRICLQRIAAVSLALVVYAVLPNVSIAVTPLELTEWPLMFAIAVLVAWMADRERTVRLRYAALYRETRDRLVRAQEEERGRIARDLHDEIGQTLTALTLNLDAATGVPSASNSAAIERSRELAREALADTRLAAERLRPPRLAEYGLGGALRSFASRAGDRIAVSVEPLADVRLPAALELDAYRIAEEAVRNALEHASASRIAVSLTRSTDDLRLVVADNGIGFDRSAVDPHRLGILGMIERAGSIGAVVSIDSSIGGGTHVELVLPLSAATAEAERSA